MPKKSLSSLELIALVKELQLLVRAKIDQVYHSEPEVILQLHSQGKKLLRIIPGKWLCLTSHKESPEKPSGFCLQLRKYLDGAIITGLYQKDTERIVVLELERSVVEEIKKVSKSREKMYLIIEFFSKGNIILANKEMIIIAALEAQEWKDRKIKPREKYMFPPESVNYTHLSKERLGEILGNSVKRNLVASLAIDLGIGGLYAEELCKISEVDKNKLPKDVNVKEVAGIYRALQELLKKVEEPLGNVYAEEVTPFTLTGQEPLKILPTYSEALDTLNPFQKASPYEQKIKVINRIIAEQEESVHHLEEQITENQRKGEWIYEHYPQVERLLNAVKEMRQTKEWKEVGEELKKIKKVVSVDLKGKKVVVEG